MSSRHTMPGNTLEKIIIFFSLQALGATLGREDRVKAWVAQALGRALVRRKPGTHMSKVG